MKVILKHTITNKYATFNDVNNIEREDTDDIKLAATTDMLEEELTDNIKESYIKYTRYYPIPYEEELKNIRKQKLSQINEK